NLIKKSFGDKNSSSDNSSTISQTSNSDNQESSENIEVPTDKTVTLYAVGDNIYHQSVINDGTDYFKFYDNIKDDIFNSDISIVNHESPIAGDQMQVSGYPNFNSPTEVAKVLSNLGFDVVNHANNHLMDKGSDGLTGTLDTWRKYPDVKIIGLYESEDKRSQTVIIEKQGIKFAFLAYTQHLNGYNLPDNMQYATNIISKSLIKSDMEKAKSNADIVIVSMHWGTEYSYNSDSFQQEYAKYLSDLGANIIIGHHPHVIEPVEWITGENGNKTLVFYSLGNLLHSQITTNTLLELSTKITFKQADNQKPYIDKVEIIPLINHYEAEPNGNDYIRKNIKIYKLSQYNDNLASSHGIKSYDQTAFTMDYINSTLNKVLDGKISAENTVFYQASNSQETSSQPLSDISASIDKSSWKLVLVNKQNFIPEDFNTDLIDINSNYNIPAKEGSFLNKTAADAISDMFTAAKGDGVNLYLRSSYRSVELQQSYYDYNVNMYKEQGLSEADAKAKTELYYAIPGKSEHHTGLAADIVTVDWQNQGKALVADFDKTEAYKWLSQNAHKFGFILRYPLDKVTQTEISYEPWHYRYVGKDSAEYIYKNNLCLEEYLK
ncbi:MAG: CapA family protein, partial [Oscillospiraceae bacterium]